MADAPDLGSGVLDVEVQVLSLAPSDYIARNSFKKNIRAILFNRNSATLQLSIKSQDFYLTDAL